MVTKLKKGLNVIGRMTVSATVLSTLIVHRPSCGSAYTAERSDLAFDSDDYSRGLSALGAVVRIMAPGGATIVCATQLSRSVQYKSA